MPFAVSAQIGYAVGSKDLTEKIAQSMRAAPEVHRSRLRMFGLVFASPDTPLAQSDILPRLGKYHARSGKHIDFYFAGYSPEKVPMAQAIPVRGPRGLWYFSQTSFDKFRKDIESKTTWEHSGDCDLLLVSCLGSEWNKLCSLRVLSSETVSYTHLTLPTKRIV